MDEMLPRAAQHTGKNPDVPGRKRKPGKTAGIIALIAAAILVGGCIFAFSRIRSAGAGGAAERRTARVIRGQIINSIAGSAPVVSSRRSELAPKVTATLREINCKEGDQVKKGDVLFVLDNTDALLDIENMKNNIAQVRLTLDSTAESIDGLVVKAPFDGLVTNINVKEGDGVNKGSALLTITDVSVFRIALVFNGDGAKHIEPGQKAVVHIPAVMQSVEGTVKYRSGRPYSGTQGSELYNVEIEIENPGSLAEGMSATAEIQAGGVVLESAGSGSLACVNKKVIKSDAGGTVISLDARENEFVVAGEELLRLENEDLLLSYSTDEIRMQSLESQLEIKQKQLEYYTVTAPFDGTITSMGTANEGDTVKQGEVLAVVSDMGSLELSIDIDELDISRVKAGQDVIITADALPETGTAPLSGKVSKIAMEGKSSNGVTTYPVTVAVDAGAAGRLKAGMNADAEIIIESKQDILIVPVEAVMKIGNRSFVYVAGQEEKNGSGGGNSPKGSTDAGGSGDGSGGGENTDSRESSSGAGTGNAARKLWNVDSASGAALGADANSVDSAAGARAGTSSTATGNAISGAVVEGAQTGNQANRALPAEKVRSALAGAKAGSVSPGALKGTLSAAMQGSAKDDYYKGAYLVEVETGISNDSYIEIISGLAEGQEVILPKTDTAEAALGGDAAGRAQGFRIFGGGIQNMGKPVIESTRGF